MHNVSLDFYVRQIYIEIVYLMWLEISDPIKMWEILLNSVLNVWLKLLIVILAENGLYF